MIVGSTPTKATVDTNHDTSIERGGVGAAEHARSKTLQNPAARGESNFDKEYTLCLKQRESTTHSRRKQVEIGPNAKAGGVIAKMLHK